MKRLSLSGLSLGVKLSVLTSLSVALLLLVLTLTQSHTASRQLENLAIDDMQNQVQGISEMATMFNATLTEEVAHYTSLFTSSCLSVLAWMKAHGCRSVPFRRRCCAPG